MSSSSVRVIKLTTEGSRAESRSGAAASPGAFAVTFRALVFLEVFDVTMTLNCHPPR
jgi:hypothetical protein